MQVLTRFSSIGVKFAGYKKTDLLIPGNYLKICNLKTLWVIRPLKTS